MNTDINPSWLTHTYAYCISCLECHFVSAAIIAGLLLVLLALCLCECLDLLLDFAEIFYTVYAKLKWYFMQLVFNAQVDVLLGNVPAMVT